MSMTVPAFTNPIAESLFRLSHGLEQVTDLPSYRLQLIRSFKKELGCEALQFRLGWNVQQQPKEDFYCESAMESAFASQAVVASVAKAAYQIGESNLISFPMNSSVSQKVEVQWDEPTQGWHFQLLCTHPDKATGRVIQNFLPLLTQVWKQAISRLIAPQKVSALAVCSPREMQILYWLAMGKSNEVMGIILGISHATVKNHVHRIYQKLNVANRSYAVHLAIREGILELGLDKL